MALRFPLSRTFLALAVFALWISTCDRPAQAQTTADLSLDMRLIGAAPQVGFQFTLDGSVGNSGPDGATNVTTDIEVPGDLDIRAIRSTMLYQLISNGPDWIIRFSSSSLAPGQGASFQIDFRPTLPGKNKLLGDVVSDIPDPAPASNQSSVVFEVRSAPVYDLALTMQSSSCVFARDLGPCSFVLTLANTGPETAPAITLVDSIPPGMTVLSVTLEGSGSWDLVGSTVMVYLDSIPAGVTNAIKIEVDAPVDGWFDNTATVSALGVDVDPTNDSASIEGIVLPPPDYVVNTTDDVDDGSCDSVHCSLREALNAANLNPNRDIIAFRIPGIGPHTIQPTTAFPQIQSSVAIDGWYQPGFCEEPLVAIDGSVAPGSGFGLLLNRGDSLLRGLAIHSFRTTPVASGAGAGHVIEGCRFGTDVTGTLWLPNAAEVRVTDNGDRVGGPHPWQRCVFTGNGGNSGWGLFASGSGLPSASGLTIENSHFGTDISGTLDFGVADAAIRCQSLSRAVIRNNLVAASGGGDPDPRNHQAGIDVVGTFQGTILIEGNRIGTDASGMVAMGNANGGISISGSGTYSGIPFYRIANNLISGNQTAGIQLSLGNGEVVGNLIGVDAMGLGALPNQGPGILLAASGITVGGSSAADRNVLSGNATSGIEISGSTVSSVAVIGNHIGVGIDGVTPVGNGPTGATTGSGIRVFGATQCQIGGTQPGEGNLIASNSGDGIQVLGSASGLVIEGNSIGVDGSGTIPLPNAASGISIFSGPTSVTIGGPSAAAANRIAHNLGHGILLGQSTSDLTIRGNSIFANALDGLRLGDPTIQRVQILANGFRNNGGLGIELLPVGPNPADALDADSGPNGGQNAPHLISASVVGAGDLHLAGSLMSSPSTSFTLRFYGLDACDPSGFGEGWTFLDSTVVTTDSAGVATVDLIVSSTAFSTLPLEITATAEGSDRATSEFSNCVAVVNPTGVSGPTPRIDSVALGPNVPNPFNPRTTLSFDLPRSAQVNLTIYDLAGRRVIALVQGIRPAGHNTVRWDGLDQSGRAVASGVYLANLRVSSQNLTRRMVLLR